jgi:hypothetical protein
LEPPDKNSNLGPFYPEVDALPTDLPRHDRYAHILDLEHLAVQESEIRMNIVMVERKVGRMSEGEECIHAIVSLLVTHH